MSLLTEPRVGRWIDENNDHRLQWLETDYVAQWLKVPVAFCLTLSTPYIIRIAISSCAGLMKILSRRNNHAAAQDEETQRPNATVLPKDAKTGRQMARSIYQIFRQQESRLELRHQFFYFFVLGTLCFVFLSQLIVSSILADKVATGPVGLLKNDKNDDCGLWEYDNMKWGEDNAAMADSLMASREIRAATYAQECYRWGKVNGTEEQNGKEKEGKEKEEEDKRSKVKRGKAMKCDFFYTPDLEFYRARAPCPFSKSAVCHTGGIHKLPAVTFDTKNLDSSLLGINSNPTYKFRRTSTCVPLSAESPYVKHFTNSPTDHGFVYFYGGFNDVRNDCPSNPKKIRNWTMRLVGHPFDWLAPVYRLNTWATSRAEPRCDYWQPIDELKSAPGLNTETRNKTLTIIFVTALHIVYANNSVDPIFPATAKYRFPDDTVDYYINDSPKSRAFTCIDETQFCDPTGKICWHAYDTIPKKVAHIARDPAYGFMANALRKSNTYDTIKLRLGSSLLAQQRVGDARSQALDNDHWEVEAEHMFRASLARAQFDAWSLASGEDHDKSTYKNTVEDEFAKRMCGLFKFRTSGHVNVLVWKFFLLCCVLPATFLLSVQWKTYLQIWNNTTQLVERLSRERGKSRDDDSAAAPMLANPEVNDDPFVVDSAPSTRRGSETPTASHPPITLRNPSPNEEPSIEDHPTTSNVADEQLSQPPGPTDDSTTTPPGTNLPTRRETSSAHPPTPPTRTVEVPANTETPLIASSARDIRDYGTSSANQSVHSSGDAANADQSPSPVTAMEQPAVNDGANSQPNDEGEDEWSPLLFHLPFLALGYIAKILWGRMRTLVKDAFVAAWHAVKSVWGRRWTATNDAPA